MPGGESLRKGEYYAHPRNRFWPLMTSLLRLPEGVSYDARLMALRRAGVGLWDVVQSCDRVGSLDADIVAAIYHDFGSFLRAYPNIQTILCNGSKAYDAFTRFVVPEIGVDCAARLRIRRLPSTSPANASYGMIEPKFVTQKPFGYGFAEGVDVLLRLREND